MTPEQKAALLSLIEEDPEVRAAAAKAAKATEGPEPEPVFDGPAWVKEKAKQHGPHSQQRFSAPKT